YLQNEHYALWEVIEFGDSYQAPLEESDTDSASESSTKKRGKTVTITTEDMQKRRNDGAILKTFGGNEATKKTKKNQLKQQYSNFKAEGSETLEQTFNRLQAIVSHLEFMGVDIKQDDLNKKFLTSLAPEWLIRKGKVHTACVPTDSTQVSTASANVAAVSISHDTVCAFIASQSNGSHIKYKDITQIDEDDIEEMDIKWNMALLRSVEHPGAKTGVEEKATNKSYMANEEENHALVADEEPPTEFALMAKSSSSFENEVYDDSFCFQSCRKNTDSLNTKITKLNEALSDSKTNLYHYKLGLSHVEARLVEFKTQEIKLCEKIRGLEFDVESKNNKIEYLMNELEQIKKEKEGLDSKLTGFESASKDIDTLLGSQRSDKNKEGLGYSAVPPSYSSDTPKIIKTNKVETARKPFVKYAEITPKAVNRTNMNAAQPKGTSFIKPTHSYVRRPFQIKSAVRTQFRVSRVPLLLKNFPLLTQNFPLFWSTARIKTMNEGTKIFATVDGKPRTISESSIKRNLKLNDEEGISSLPDAELFEKLALMRYNILPNQKFTFQKGQFSHQWKFLIHTIMQCLSPKSTGFNEFSCNIATAVGEGSGTPTESHHTPSPQAQQSPHHDLSSSLHPSATTESIPTKTPIQIPTLRQYFRRATWIAQSKALPTAADEPASLLRDDSQREAFPTVSSLDAGHERENIIKTALPHDSTTRVTSLDADEGNMQQKLQELMELYTSLQRKQTEMASKIKAQDLKISSLKASIKLLKDKDRGSAELSGDDALIKGRNIEIGEEAGVEKSTERGIVSVPPIAGFSTVGVPTVSDLAPIVSALFTTASVAREMEEEMARDNQRMNEQIARDAEIARIHTEEELKMMIDGLDRSNEIIAKHLQEYEQSEAELTIGEKIELINELVKYQDHHAKILKYLSQQSKPLSKKEQKEFYMLILKSYAGWKTKHFRGKRKKRKGLKLDEGSAKRMKTSEDVSGEDLKGMMQLVPAEETGRAHNSLPILYGYAKTAGQRRPKLAVGFGERNPKY
nr:hypothetical protein [Tanacetum cinerariifolium]